MRSLRLSTTSARQVDQMAKAARTAFVCQQCGHAQPRWLGQCPACEQWGSLVEEIVDDRRARAQGGAASSAAPKPQPLAAVEASPSLRRSTGVGELDRVLGGGLVQGSIVLIGGDPGIGKSTLALQACGALARQGAAVLYVAGEESPEQVRLRADRLGLGDAAILVLAETTTELVVSELERVRPVAVVVDSIQTLHTSALGSAPGSVAQVRESASELVARCKAQQTACFLIGHVTKEGALAGPRVLEHLVDTVLYFEGDGAHALRILRAVKNRFGSTNEVGVFEMGEGGLAEVANPSAAFLAERPVAAPGSAVLATLEGSRPVLVEIQALVARSVLVMPRRTAIGLDAGRVALLLAVLEKRSGVRLHDQDVFLNVAGGLRVDEPAADLAIAAAVASSAAGRPLAQDVVVWGEVGLTGEVRSVARSDARVREAARLGFRRCLLPTGNARALAVADAPAVRGVASVAELFEVLEIR
jgi:DNA repair protein RadA/Sms